MLKNPLEPSHMPFTSIDEEMGDLINHFDWSKTPLGPVKNWSQALTMMVRILLSNRFPMLLWWGPKYIQIYNDAYRPVLGVKHSERALGLPVSECWNEIWHVLKPLIDAPFHGDSPTWMEDIELKINRYGFTEETHFTIAYSAVPDTSVADGIGGVLATVHEITEKVFAERRVSALRDLGAGVGDARTTDEACAKAASILSKHSRDIPFALFYIVDLNTRTARLAGSCGVNENSSDFAPSTFSLDATSSTWPIASVVKNRVAQDIDLESRFKDSTLACLSAKEDLKPTTAITLPIRSNKSGELAGVLIIGASPEIPLNKQYRDFFELVGDQVAAALNNARNYEEERNRAEALAALDLAKTKFFSNVSHEFRTPLTLMLGPLQDLLQLPLAPAERAGIELAHRNSMRLLKLVNTMLDFSRIEAGRIQAHFCETDLCGLTRDLTSLFQSATDRAGLTLKLECEKLNAPTYVDRDMWEKIVLNLLSNAFKFTFSGGITVRIKGTKAHAIFEVEDTGTGIAKNELPKLFERFHRIEGTHGRTHEGTGIGLALVHELIHLHGGTISVNSQLGKGTKFTVSIPTGRAHLPQKLIIAKEAANSKSSRAEAYVDEVASWLAASASSRQSSSLAQVDSDYLPEASYTADSRILLIDDNADMRNYVANLLRKFWKVEVACDGQEALEILKNKNFDMLITDVMMPNLGGFELLRELRSHPETVNTPVIMISARADEEARIEGLTAGADDYITKPFTARDFVARVHASLKINKIRQESKNNAEKARQEVYEFFMQVPSPLVVLSGPEHRFALVNPAYEKFVGRSVLGKTVLQAFTKDEVGEFVKLLDGVYQTGQAYLGHELPLSLPDEAGVIHQRIINVAYHPMREANGSIKGILAVHQDITEQKNTEAKLTRAKEEAEKASQLKSSFLANMSHEIRTPLGVIMGFSDLIVDANTSPSERTHFAEVLKRNGEHLSVIINDILDLSKVEAGELKVDPTTFSLRQIVADVFSVMESRAKEKGIKLECDFSSVLSDEVMTDKVRVKQIISNLIGNAIKFTERGCVTLSVSCRAEDCVFEIKDTGLGISPEQQEKLFKPFSQVDESNTRKYGGTGLGLTLSKKLAQTLGGDLKLKKSSPGKGSTFQFFFKNLTPHQAQAVAAMPHVDPRRLVNEDAPLKNLNVLLVEDSEDNQKLISHILKRQGAHIAIANNGEEGVTQAVQGEHDLILMDIQMPVMDGYTAAQILRKRGYKKPIIALTAHAMAEVREKCLSVGYTDHLVKPINFGELIKKVGEYGFRH